MVPAALESMGPSLTDELVDCCGAAVEWLPSEIHQESVEVEPRHLSELVAELSAAWSALRNCTNEEEAMRANNALCDLVAPMRAMCTAAPPVSISAIKELVATLAEAATFRSARVQLFTRARLVGLLERVLARFGRLSLPGIELDWEPLYDAIFNVVLRSNTTFLDSDNDDQEQERVSHGPMLEMSLRHGLRSVASSLRKYLHRGSAAEILNRCKRLLEMPPMTFVSVEGLVMLAVMLPFKGQPTEGKPIDWQNCAKVLANSWASAPPSQLQDSLYLYLFSRILKYHSEELKSFLAEGFLVRLLTIILQNFTVPLAGSVAHRPSAAGGLIPGSSLSALTARHTNWVDCATRCIVSLLAIEDFKVSQRTLEHVERIFGYLEPYYHPSNGGQWTEQLDSFLGNITSRLYRQHVLSTAKASSEAKSCESLVRVFNGRLLVSNEVIEKVYSILVKIIEPSLFSKSTSMVKTAVKSAAMIAYIFPEKISSIAVSKLQTALAEDCIATHQLKSALKLMTELARPLLLDGEAGTEGNSAREILGFSLRETLPGLDPNDASKTTWTLRLWLAVLNSLYREKKSYGKGIEEALKLPGIGEDWVDSVFDRILNIIKDSQALPQSAQQEGKRGGSERPFGNSTFKTCRNVFRPFIQIIATIISRNHRTLLIKRLGAFWRDNDIGGVTSDFGLICMPIVNVDIDDFLMNEKEAKIETMPSMVHLCLPLLDAVDDHLNDIILNSKSSSEEPTINANLQSKTVTLLHLLAHILTASGDIISHLEDRIRSIMWKCFGVNSSNGNAKMILPERSVMKAAGDVLFSVLTGSLSYFINETDLCSDQSSATVPFYSIYDSRDQDLIKNENIVLSSTCISTERIVPELKWHRPGEEACKMATRLVEDVLKHATENANFLASNQPKNNGTNVRNLIYALCTQLSSVVGGCGTSIAGLTMEDEALAKKGMRLSGSTSAFTLPIKNLREKAVEILLSIASICARDFNDDVVILREIIFTANEITNMGSREYSDTVSGVAQWARDSEYMKEPASLSFLWAKNSKGEANFVGKFWQERCPWWLCAELVELKLRWRASQRPYRVLSQQKKLPSILERLVLELMIPYSMHPYKLVRDGARVGLENLAKRSGVLCKLITRTLVSELGRTADKSTHQDAFKDKDLKDGDERIQGACSCLIRRPFGRVLSQDSELFGLFIASVCSSFSRTDSLLDQVAISELALSCISRLPSITMSEEGEKLYEGWKCGLEEFGLRTGKALSFRESTNCLIVDELMEAALLGCGVGLSDEISKPHWRLSMICYGVILFLRGICRKQPLIQFFWQLLQHDFLPSSKAIAAKALIDLGKDVSVSVEGDLITKLSGQHSSNVDGSHNVGKYLGMLASRGGSLYGIGSGSMMDCIPQFFWQVNSAPKIDSNYRLSNSNLQEILALAVLSQDIPWIWPLSRRSRILQKSERVWLLHSRLVKQLIDSAEPREAFVLSLQEEVKAASTIDTSDRGIRATLAEVWAGCVAYGMNSNDGQEWWANGPFEKILRESLSSAEGNAVGNWLLAVRYSFNLCMPSSSDDLGIWPHTRRLSLAALLVRLSSDIAKSATSVLQSRGWMLLASIAAEILDPLIALAMKSNADVNKDLEGDILNLIDSFKETLEDIKLAFSEGSPQIREAMTSFLSQFLGAMKSYEVKMNSETEYGSNSKDPDMECSFLIKDRLQEMFMGFSILLKSITEQADSISDFVALKELSTDKERNGTEEPTHLDEKLELTKKKAWMESTMLVLRALVFQGEGALFLKEIVALLPSLFKLQELPDVELSSVAARALINVKYVSFWDPEDLSACIKQIADCMLPNAEVTSLALSWRARYAVQSFAQAFFIRHSMAVTKEDVTYFLSKLLVSTEDPKLEVREAAAVTLNGVLKSDVFILESVKNDSLNDILRLIKKQRVRRRKNKAADSGNIEDKEDLSLHSAKVHARVLQLSACVRCYPYDCPEWVPDALEKISELSNLYGHPLSRTVQQVLAEFRKTHIDTWDTVKILFTEEQMEIFGDYSSALSYFV